ncbi:MAG: hypothetical protein LUD15_02725 [Bacteroides sp.]|nr:hypothetical protein [Bacteroides sp.]
MSPLTEPYDEEGALSLWPNEDDISTVNPLESLNAEYEYGVKSIHSNSSFKVDLPFIPGLSYKLLYGYNYYVIDTELYKSSKNTVQGMVQKGYAEVIHQNSQK